MNRRSCKKPMVFAALFAFTLAVVPFALPVIATDVPAVPEAAPLIDQGFDKLMLLYSNLGLAGVFLAFLLWSLRRQASLEILNDRFEKHGVIHLAAFKEISTNATEAFRQINDRNTTVLRELCEDYRAVAKESRDVSYMIAGSNERIVTMLEMMQRGGGAKG